jgi:hypothetical protein
MEYYAHAGRSAPVPEGPLAESHLPKHPAAATGCRTAHLGLGHPKPLSQLTAFKGVHGI